MRDAKHLDSAYRAGCSVFLTSDKDDLWSKRDRIRHCIFRMTGRRSKRCCEIAAAVVSRRGGLVARPPGAGCLTPPPYGERGERDLPSLHPSPCMFLPIPTPQAARACAHSITSSARSSSDCGIVRPSVFAVFRLMLSCNFVGRSIGKSRRSGALPRIARFHALAENALVDLKLAVGALDEVATMMAGLFFAFSDRTGSPVLRRSQEVQPYDCNFRSACAESRSNPRFMAFESTAC